MASDPTVQENLTLVRLMSGFWDPHMAVPVLQWMREHNLLEEKSCVELQEAILPSTPEGVATAVATTIHRSGGPKDPAEAAEVVKELEAQSEQLVQVLGAYKRDQQKKIGGYAERRRLEEIIEWYTTMKAGSQQPVPTISLPPSAVFAPYRLGGVYYASGDYNKALQQLDIYLNTVADLTHEGSDLENPVSCIWGICACIILLHNTECPAEEAKKKEQEKDQELLQQLQEGEDSKEVTIGTVEAHGAARCILKLADILDQSQNATSKAGTDAASNDTVVFSREEQLRQRAWLLHWGIWLIYRYYLVMIHTKGYTPRNQAWSGLLDWLVQERNLACVHLLCPHLLRYYAVYAILNRKRKDHFQAIVAAISHSKNKYTDVFTQLLEALFSEFNFDIAQNHISSLTGASQTDFFLSPLAVSVNEHARLLIFETYCRIHKCINVDMIAKKLNMTSETAERWIVNLIRNARLEARIDSGQNRVQMSTAPPNMYQQVIEKTRNLCIRSNLLFQNLTRPSTGREEEVPFQRGNRGGRGRGRQWVRGGQEAYRESGGRGRRGMHRDPMSAAAANMSSRRRDDATFAD